jgi:hypothetical protein
LVFGEPPNVTVLNFPDKLPIGYELDRYRHVFLYLARSPSPMDFRVFILRHLELLNALGFWTIRVLFPRSMSHSMEGDRAIYLAASPISRDALSRGRGSVQCAELPHEYEHLLALARLGVRRNGQDAGDEARGSTVPHPPWR